MANILFISDIHAGHKNIIKFRNKTNGESFESEEEHFQLVKSNYHERVTKRDIVYFLGDIAFNTERLLDVGTWAGKKKILVLGNHDTDKLTVKQIVDSGAFDEIYGLTKKYGCWISHAPIHESELRGKMNIHGHTHQTNVDDPRYVNVSLDQTNMSPISLDEIRKILDNRNL